jgi:Uma2 family endonuclease
VPHRPTGARVSVLPDWVCEVLSSNRRKDLVEKRARLRDAGVGHYWIVHPEARVLEVLRHAPEGYLVVTSVAPGTVARLEPFEQVELEASRLFGDFDEGQAE